MYGIHCIMNCKGRETFYSITPDRRVSNLGRTWLDLIEHIFICHTNATLQYEKPRSYLYRDTKAQSYIECFTFYCDSHHRIHLINQNQLMAQGACKTFHEFWLGYLGNNFIRFLIELVSDSIFLDR